jgi:predicted metal-dependent phosphoesterase TrpH
MFKADLHVHSRYSLDGELGINELLMLCRGANLDVVSVTDHNLVRAVSEAIETGSQYGIRIIPGIEIDCRFKGIDLHVLGYHIDHTSADFVKLEQDIFSAVMDSFPKMVQKLSGQGIHVDPEEVLSLAGSNLPSGELIAEVLLTRDKYSGNKRLDPYRKGGHRSDMPYINFYHDFFAQGKPAYVKIEYMEFREAIALLRRNGGVPVVAHPGLNLKGREEIAEELLDNGAEGLEVFNNYHDLDQIEYFVRTGLKRGVLMTCGSDFHGKTKPLIRPGTCRTISRYENDVFDSIDKLLSYH